MCSGEWSWVSSLWNSMKCLVVSFGGVYGFGMALCCLSAAVQSCVPVLLKDWCEGYCTGAS